MSAPEHSEAAEPALLRHPPRHLARHLRRHLGGLALAAGCVAVFVVVWLDGLPLLEGTIFEDLWPIAAGLSACVILRLAESLAALAMRRFPGDHPT